MSGKKRWDNFDTGSQLCFVAALLVGRNDPGFLHNGPLAGLVAAAPRGAKPVPLRNADHWP